LGSQTTGHCAKQCSALVDGYNALHHAECTSRGLGSPPAAGFSSFGFSPGTPEVIVNGRGGFTYAPGSPTGAFGSCFFGGGAARKSAGAPASVAAAAALANATAVGRAWQKTQRTVN